MNDTQRGQTTGLILAFLAGALSGAVVALLTAPSSGRETRSRLKDVARDASGRAAGVPPALNEAYARAARRAFVLSLESLTQDSGPPSSRSGH